MSKNILIISSSPRKGGNSDLLCDEFMRGAGESGHHVEKIRISDQDINYCTGCCACIGKQGACIQKDDMNDIFKKILAADVMVLATPVYFHAMTAQMKTFIDRVCPIYSMINQSIKVEGGRIKGGGEDGLTVFKGIPYAAPPMGDLRWKAPQPVVPWQGVRVTDTFGPACPQPPFPDTNSMRNTVGNMSEDCLYLNVWTPAASSGEKRPVMVWIHGGGFAIGSPGLKSYDGTNFAQKGMVFVNFAYRLGALGFLAHPQRQPARLEGESLVDAAHADEINYVFGHVDHNFNFQYTDEDRKLSSMMMDYWVSFAQNGNPNTNGLPLWPQFNHGDDAVMVLKGTAPHPGPVPNLPQLEFVERYFQWLRDSEAP